MDRRSFLTTLTSALAAPAIPVVARLQPLPYRDEKLWVYFNRRIYTVVGPQTIAFSEILDPNSWEPSPRHRVPS